MEQRRTHRLRAFLGSRHLSLANSGYRQPHSIISLARERSEGGTVRPSDLAALRLITSSNLVALCTGNSVLNVSGVSPTEWAHLQPKRRRRGLNRSKLA